jgi:hypothetical protein
MKNVRTAVAFHGPASQISMCQSGEVSIGPTLGSGWIQQPSFGVARQRYEHATHRTTTCASHGIPNRKKREHCRAQEPTLSGSASVSFQTLI